MSESSDEFMPPTGPVSLEMDFDQSVEKHGIRDHELPQVFASWLQGHRCGGRDGQVRDIIDDRDVAGSRCRGSTGPTADYGGGDEPDQRGEEGPAGYPGLVPDGRSG